MNEVISSLPLGNEKTNNILKVYDNSGKIIKRFSFSDKNIYFQNINYDNTFSIVGFTTFRTSLNEFNLLLIAGNGRSPNFIARLDSNLNIVGKYWHYGNISGMTINNNQKIGKNILVLTGTNDVKDMDFNAFPVVMVLDPEKIAGNNEASATKGFGLNNSQSELYYIRFPRTDMEMALKINVGAFLRDNIIESKLDVMINGNDLGNSIGFDYIFSPDEMRILEVKFNSPTETTHKKLKTEGKIHSTFDEKYLENLKNGVEYWDGERWMKEVVQVKH